MSILSEEVGYTDLPGVVVAALLVESERTAGSLRSRFPSDIGRLATGDIVIGTYLEMLQSSDAEAKVNAEVALLQGIVASLCPLEVFSADIECHLRTGKEEDVGRTAQTDCITHIHRDSNLLLLHGLFSDS